MIRKLQPHDVYTARFGYLDSDQNKVRPVIVISQPQGKHKIIAVVPLSSKSGMEPVDFTIQGIESAGLLKPSVARVHKLTTLPGADLRTRLGAIGAKDRTSLTSAVRSFLSPSL